MSGYEGYGGRRERSRSPRRGDRSYRGRRDESPRGQSTGRGGPPRGSYSSGRGGDNRRGDSHRGRGGHGDYEGDGGRQGRSEGSASASNLPPLPQQAPFPNGTGKSVPYPDDIPRGSAGEKILVDVNHFVIETLPIVKIFQYELHFRVPPASQRRGSEKVTANQLARLLLCSTVVSFLGEHFVFDGVSLGWSPKMLFPVGEERQTTISLSQKNDGPPNDVEIAIKNVGPLNIVKLVEYLRGGNIELNPSGNPLLEDIFKWLNAVYRADPASRMTTRPNSNAFFLRNESTSTILQSTGGVLEAIRGVFQAVQLRNGRLVLNVDTATTPFWVPGLSYVDVARTLMGLRQNENLQENFLQRSDQFFQACARLLGSYFVVRHLDGSKNERKIRFNGWSKFDAQGTTFEEKITESETRTTTVEDYFPRKYNIVLKYPNIPLAKTRAGEFPLELCFSAPGERYREVLQGAETADFIRFSTAPGHIRKSQIVESLKILHWHTNPTPEAHGLSASPNFFRKKGRILPAPDIHYGQGVTRQVREGAWNLKGLQFLCPSTIQSWGLVYFPNSRPVDQFSIQTFGAEIVKGFRNVGMQTPRDPPVTLLGNIHGDVQAIIKEVVAKASNFFGAPPDVIFVLLQEASTPLYNAVKFCLETQVGISSQIMLTGKALKQAGQLQYIANIAMKVNVKLGGTNCEISEPLFQRSRWMIIGADLSAPAPSALRKIPPPPSTAAVTATWNKACNAFTCVTSFQTSTSQQIELISVMFSELIGRYKEKNGGLLPERIIYYRDGVSDSEFDQIKINEGKVLKGLIDGVKITIIVVVKRHHTRLFPVQQHQGSKLGNVLPGTIIENSSTRNDSYLVPHRELQGTKRPVRYVTIVDDNNLSQTEFERVTYCLCATYSRSTTTVAVIPAVRYADQACTRARLHLQDTPNGTQLRPVANSLRFTMYWQ